MEIIAAGYTRQCNLFQLLDPIIFNEILLEVIELGGDIDVVKNRFPWDAHDEYEKGNLTNQEWFLAFRDSLPQPCCLKETDFWVTLDFLIIRRINKKCIKNIESINNYQHCNEN